MKFEHHPDFCRNKFGHVLFKYSSYKGCFCSCCQNYIEKICYITCLIVLGKLLVPPNMRVALDEIFNKSDLEL